MLAVAAKGGRRVRKKSKRSAGPEEFPATASIQGEPLEPVRIVERELTRPDGTTLKVDVPVYPPFRLKQRGSAASRSEKVKKAS